MEALIARQPLDNAPQTQRTPSRLTGEEILKQIRDIYGISEKKSVGRDHSEAYRMAVWLLRRAANLPLKEVATLFDISISRISHIQKQMEQIDLNAKQEKLLEICKVKK